MISARQLRRGSRLIASAVREMGQQTPFIATSQPSGCFFDDRASQTPECTLHPVRSFSTAPMVSEDPIDIISSMSNEDLADTSTIPGWEFVHHPPRDFPRGALVGTVVSDKMDKTVNVAVDRYRIVPKYRKRQKYTHKFMAHDEHQVANLGDMVMIVPCHRISKHKHFMLKEIIRAKGQL
mmetsp:Transcript_21992/g.36403  ORF Transcript_21992/g.36403 Transcript_21992/m.36403 type:complete len:180 (+) Transcript_21992:105-644(+)